MRKLWVLMLFLCLFLVGCKEESLLDVQGKERLEIGFSYEYKILYNGVEIDESEVYFNVSNLKICEVEGNTITALDSGLITLTVALKDDPTIYISKKLEIIDPLVTDIKIRGDKVLKEGEEILLEAIVTPEDTTIPVEWESSDPSIATVDDGIVMGIKGGTVTITATCSSAKAEFTITVIGVIREIEVEGNSEIEVNSTGKYEFNIDDPIITTDSTNICIIDNYVYAIEIGKAVLHIVSESNPNLDLDFEINVVSSYNDGIEMTEEEREEVNSIMNSLTVEQKLGQMIILNVRGNSLFLDEEGLAFTTSSGGTTVRTHYLKDIITFPVGNIVVTNYNSTNKGSLQNYIKGMQDFIMEDAGIGAIVLCDRSSFASESLTDGYTEVADNLLLGTANDVNLLKKYYGKVSDEIKNTGINTVVYSGYTRSTTIFENFSNNDSRQILFSKIVNDLFNDKQVNVGTYYGQIDYANDEFLRNEKLMEAAINDNVDFILTQNSLNFYLNKGVTIPYYLRNLGYQGIIMPSLNDYNTISSNNNGLNVPSMEYCIENGYDLIPLNVYTSSYQLESNPYILSAFDTTVDKINNGEIDINIVNAAVERILLYKIRNGIINGTYPENMSFSPQNTIISEAENALKFISTKGEFDGLNKEKTLYVFSTLQSNGDYRNPIYYDLGETMYNAKNSYGYTEIDYYTFNEFILLEPIGKIQSDDQVVIGIYGSQIWFDYKDGEYIGWDSISWADIISQISLKTDDIVIVNMESPSITKSLENLGYPIIYMNGRYDSKFKNLLDFFKDGKSNGVAYYE